MNEPAPEKIRFDPEKLKQIIKDKKYTEARLCLELGYSHSYLSFIRSNGCELKKSDMKAICYTLGITEKDILPDEPIRKPKPEAGQDFTRLTKLLEQINTCCSNMESRITALDAKLADMDRKLQGLTKETAAIKSDLENVGSDMRVTRGNTNTLKQQQEKVRIQSENLAKDVKSSGDNLSEQINALKLDLNDALYDLIQKLTEPAEQQPEPEPEPPQTVATRFITEMLNAGVNEENEILEEARRRGIERKQIEYAKTAMNITVIPQGYGRKQRKIWTC